MVRGFPGAAMVNSGFALVTAFMGMTNCCGKKAYSDIESGGSALSYRPSQQS